ncbi:unannotated protein [freshwater metagenome]
MRSSNGVDVGETYRKHQVVDVRHRCGSILKNKDQALAIEQQTKKNPRQDAEIGRWQEAHHAPRIELAHVDALLIAELLHQQGHNQEGAHHEEHIDDSCKGRRQV